MIEFTTEGTVMATEGDGWRVTMTVRVDDLEYRMAAHVSNVDAHLSGGELAIYRLAMDKIAHQVERMRGHAT